MVAGASPVSASHENSSCSGCSQICPRHSTLASSHARALGLPASPCWSAAKRGQTVEAMAFHCSAIALASSSGFVPETGAPGAIPQGLCASRKEPPRRALTTTTVATNSPIARSGKRQAERGGGGLGGGSRSRLGFRRAASPTGTRSTRASHDHDASYIESIDGILQVQHARASALTSLGGVLLDLGRDEDALLTSSRPERATLQSPAKPDMMDAEALSP